MSIQSVIYGWEKAAGIDRPKLPQLPEDDERFRRLAFIEEEYKELIAAFAAADLTEVADALGDLIWVTYGTAHACGIDIDRVIMEIAASNWTKLPAKRNAAGKILKGPDFMPPDIKPILDAQEPLDV